MAKLDWNRARKFRGSEPAFPGKPRRKTTIVRTWDDLERAATGDPALWVGQAKPQYGQSLTRIADAEIVAAMSPRGGWTRATLANWGVPWPPPKGWRRALVEGRPIPKR